MARSTDRHQRVSGLTWRDALRAVEGGAQVSSPFSWSSL
jgi:hypothetical protein